jgi:DNA-directed RNA polymerase specialized sigma24 family protein
VPAEGRVGAGPSASRSPWYRWEGAEALKRYEGAPAELRDEDRQAIVLCVEFGLDYDEIATQMGKATPSANRQLAFIVSPTSAMDRGRLGCRR